MSTLVRLVGVCTLFISSLATGDQQEKTLRDIQITVANVKGRVAIKKMDGTVLASGTVDGVPAQMVFVVKMRTGEDVFVWCGDKPEAVVKALAAQESYHQQCK